MKDSWSRSPVFGPVEQTMEEDTVTIAIGDIRAERQVRTRFRETRIAALAHSLSTVGQQQAITVYCEQQSGHYVVIHGERRLRAAITLGWKSIRARIRACRPSEDERIELQLAENVVRQDLNDIELAEALLKLRELRGYSTRELAKRVGKSQTSVVRLLSLLTLPEELKQHVIEGTLPGSVAYEIGKLPLESEQRLIAKRYLDGKITRTGVTECVQSGSPAADAGKARSRSHRQRRSPWPVKLDGGNGLRVLVMPGKQADEEAFTFAEVKQALEEALAEVDAWVKGRVQLI